MAIACPSETESCEATATFNSALRRWPSHLARTSVTFSTPAVSLAVLSAEEAESLFQEACALARQRADQRSLAVLHGAMGNFVGVTGDLRRMLELGTEAVRIAAECDDTGLRYATSSDLSYGYFAAGRIKEAYEFNDGLLRNPPGDLRIGAEITTYAPYLQLRTIQGLCSALMLDLNTAEVTLREAAQLAKGHRGDVEFIAVTSFVRADFAALRGDGEAAVARLSKSLSRSARRTCVRTPAYTRRVQSWLAAIGATRIVWPARA